MRTIDIEDEIMEEDIDEDIYSRALQGELLDEEEIDDSEEAFLRGYSSA